MSRKQILSVTQFCIGYSWSYGVTQTHELATFSLLVVPFLFLLELYSTCDVV